MSIKFRCKSCEKVLETKDERAGKVGKCPHCGNRIEVPNPAASKKRKPVQQDPWDDDDDWDVDGDDEEDYFAGSRPSKPKAKGVTCDVCGAKNAAKAKQCKSCGESLAPEKSRHRRSGTSKEKAHFGVRFGAYIIDMIIVNMTSFVLGVVVGVILVATGEREVGPGVEAVLNIMGFVVGLLYFALLESSTNQATVGKMALGIIVTDTDGHRISFGNALGRYFGKIISVLVCGLGFIWAGFDKQSQAWHDKMANTFVVKKN